MAPPFTSSLTVDSGIVVVVADSVVVVIVVVGSVIVVVVVDFGNNVESARCVPSYEIDLARPIRLFTMS